MFVHALSGAASFAACLRLFRSYPLAVNLSYPDDPGPPGVPAQGRDGRDSPAPCHSGGWHRSIVLRHLAFEGSGFYVLTQDPAEQFTLRPWNPDDGECQEIRPGAPVPVTSHRVITEGMPVPRDGALLGWVSDRQATALLSVYHGQPASEVRVPQVRVLAMVGSEPMRWPPFTASPLDDGRFWEYAERGEIVDLAPVVIHGAKGAFWVPSQHVGRNDGGDIEHAKQVQLGPRAPSELDGVVPYGSGVWGVIERHEDPLRRTAPVADDQDGAFAVIDDPRRGGPEHACDLVVASGAEDHEIGVVRARDCADLHPRRSGGSPCFLDPR